MVVRTEVVACIRVAGLGRTVGEGTAGIVVEEGTVVAEVGIVADTVVAAEEDTATGEGIVATEVGIIPE